MPRVLLILHLDRATRRDKNFIAACGLAIQDIRMIGHNLPCSSSQREGTCFIGSPPPAVDATTNTRGIVARPSGTCQMLPYSVPQRLQTRWLGPLVPLEMITSTTSPVTVQYHTCPNHRHRRGILIADGSRNEDSKPNRPRSARKPDTDEHRPTSVGYLRPPTPHDSHHARALVRRQSPVASASRKRLNPT